MGCVVIISTSHIVIVGIGVVVVAVVIDVTTGSDDWRAGIVAEEVASCITNNTATTSGCQQQKITVLTCRACTEKSKLRCASYRVLTI